MGDQSRSASVIESIPDFSPEEHRGYLLKFALLQLRDPHLAEDAVQETLLAALSAREGFAGRSSLRTWLTGILKHKIVDLQRRQARETPIADLLRTEAERETDEFDVLFRQRDDHWETPPRDWGGPGANPAGQEILAGIRAVRPVHERGRGPRVHVAGTPGHEHRGDL